MVCPVCGQKSEFMLCPECGFDSSRDYERYPTLAPVGKTPAVSALQKEWQAKNTKKKSPWLPMIACAAILVLGIGIGVGLGGEKTVPTEPVPIVAEMGNAPWSENVLQSDGFPKNRNISLGEAREFAVFGSEYQREQISSITFMNSLTDAPEDAWDASETGTGKVLAWVIPNGELYDLYIGAEGGVSAGKSCHSLFCGYVNVQRIHFANAFHTENVQNMRNMFHYCQSLTSLDLSCFETVNVQDMSQMFQWCNSLTVLDLSSFDTAVVQDMSAMFADCTSLTSLDLSSFDTANVDDMSSMFYYCTSLTSLDLSNFDTANVQDMSNMFGFCDCLTSLNLSSFNTAKVHDMSKLFYNCTSLTSLDLSSFDTADVWNTTDMFYDCPAGTRWQHLLK